MHHLFSPCRPIAAAASSSHNSGPGSSDAAAAAAGTARHSPGAAAAAQVHPLPLVKPEGASNVLPIRELNEFRRGVGLCIYRRDGLVFAARRLDDPQGSWQMPQVRPRLGWLASGRLRASCLCAPAVLGAPCPAAPLSAWSAAQHATYVRYAALHEPSQHTPHLQFACFSGWHRPSGEPHARRAARAARGDRHPERAHRGIGACPLQLVAGSLCSAGRGCAQPGATAAAGSAIAATGCCNARPCWCPCDCVSAAGLLLQIDHWLEYTFPTRVREPGSILKYRGQTQVGCWVLSCRNVPPPPCGQCRWCSPLGRRRGTQRSCMQPGWCALCRAPRSCRPAAVASTTLHDAAHGCRSCRAAFCQAEHFCSAARLLPACRNGSFWSSAAATTRLTLPAARTQSSASLAGAHCTPCPRESCTSSRACTTRWDPLLRSACDRGAVGGHCAVIGLPTCACLRNGRLVSCAAAHGWWPLCCAAPAQVAAHFGPEIVRRCGTAAHVRA